MILDSPPVAAGDRRASCCAREADGVVLVVKGHDTPRELVRRARDQLVQSPARTSSARSSTTSTSAGATSTSTSRYYGYYGRRRSGRRSAA